jgi:hypothetical protein
MNRPLRPAESKRWRNLARMERSMMRSYAKPKRNQWLAPLLRR